MVNLADKEICTGCQACENVCPKNAIYMQQNDEGFFEPVIDRQLCVECKKCIAVCPTGRGEGVDNDEGQGKTKLYASINYDSEVRLQSSSGGVFTTLAEAVLCKGGVVFGAEFADDMSIRHNYVEAVNDIYKFRTSKYVQSYIGQSFQEVKRFLDLDRWVLFTGTSCQIEGLYRFLGRDYDKLFTADLICSGNTSPGVWMKYLDAMKEKYQSDISRINFRDKKYGWDRYSLHISFTSGKEYRKILLNDPWAYFFLHHQSIRECCYECSYKQIRHNTDFTLGDFWGVQQEYPELYDDKGLSFVLVHTDKAYKLWNDLDTVEKKEIPIEMLEKHNTAIVKAPYRPDNRKEFFDDYKRMEFFELAKKYARISLWKRYNLVFDIYWRIRIIGGKFYRRIKKL